MNDTQVINQLQSMKARLWLNVNSLRKIQTHVFRNQGHLYGYVHELRVQNEALIARTERFIGELEFLQEAAKDLDQ